MKKIALFIVALIIIGGGYYYFSGKNKQAMAPSAENFGEKEEETTENEEIETPAPAAPPPAPTPTPPPANTQKESQGTYSSGEEGMSPDVLVVQVNYDGNKFDPASVDIKIDDIVIFKNNSSSDFWPASSPHPTHTTYPAFDPKAAISAGGKWQFKFDKAGSWKYHDHLNPGVGGAVNVK